jgi:anti-sigma factor RsiW
MTAACGATRLRLLDYRRGLLAAAEHEAVRAHLDECADCEREDAAEQGLSEALERRLPQYPAPRGLKRRLAPRWGAAPPARLGSRALRPGLVIAGLVAALALFVVIAVSHRPPGPGDVAPVLALEAVNDHLRIVEAGRRLDVQSADGHQVRPWFTGRLDFAPRVPFGGDDEFPLRGGAIERFLDRRAAVFVYGRRLHTISLLVFRADGLPWPAGWESRSERASFTVRGFNVLLWRDRDLGYAMVSDLNVGELQFLGTRLATR